MLDATGKVEAAFGATAVFTMTAVLDGAGIVATACIFRIRDSG